VADCKVDQEWEFEFPNYLCYKVSIKKIFRLFAPNFYEVLFDYAHFCRVYKVQLHLYDEDIIRTALFLLVSMYTCQSGGFQVG
jgi:hypothetical protein